MSDVIKILYRDNIKFDSNYKDLLLNKDFYENYQIKGGDNHYSSFFNFKNSLEELNLISYLNPFYNLIISEILKKYNLRKATKFDFQFWWQIYNNKTGGHGDHTHFSPSKPAIFSFVHYINVNDSDPCFHFINEDGSEEYINEKTNDFILFGSWSRHRVKQPSSSETRAIIAGNISIIEHISEKQYFED